MKKTYAILCILLVALSACGVKRDLHLVGTKPGTPPPHRHMPGKAPVRANVLDPTNMNAYESSPQYTPYQP